MKKQKLSIWKWRVLWYSQAKVMSNKCHLVIPRNNFVFSDQAVLRSIWDHSSWQRIEPVFPALEAWSLNHWTAREVPLGIQRVGRQTRTHTYIKPGYQRQKPTQKTDEMRSPLKCERVKKILSIKGKKSVIYVFSQVVLGEKEP